MTSFEVSSDSGAAKDWVARLLWNERAGEWADEVGPALLARIRQEAPVGKGPGAGRLRDSIGYRKTTSSGQVTLEYFSDGVPYVPYVLHGTLPHDIYPVVALALHWVDHEGPHFRQHVRHPGTAKNEFPQRAGDAMWGQIRDRFERKFTNDV